MLILDGVYIERGYGSLVRFQWVKAPTSDELAQLTHTIARRVGRFLERQGLIERDADDCMDAGGRATQGAVAENSYLTGDAVDDESMAHLQGHSITSATAPALLYLPHPWGLPYRCGSASGSQGVHLADIAGLRSRRSIGGHGG